MNRLLPLSGLAILAACGVRGSEPQRASSKENVPVAQPAERPNIVVILADDLGYGDLGAYGGDVIQTPRIDAMAAAGISLAEYYAPANVCTPSRAGLLTGRYPIRYGLAAGVIHPDTEDGLPPEEVTIAEVLSEAGYETAMVGKWHLGHREGLWPTDQGFGRFLGVPYSNDMQPFPLMRGTEIIEGTADQRTLTKRYTEEAVAFIEETDAPFFLYLAHTFPHIPLFASNEFEGTSEAGRYGDTVEEVDWSTGRILDALEARGITEDTLVVFTSDNGPWFEGSPGNARGRKGETYGGGHRVPFVAAWPGTIPAGSTSDAVVTGLDLMPTLARLAGAALPEADIDGADAFAVLSEGAPSPHESVLLFNEDQVVGFREGDWQLVTQAYYKTYDVTLTSVGYPLLFDLSRDPSMRYSLASAEPERTARMLAAVKAARGRLNVPPPPPLPGR